MPAYREDRRCDAVPRLPAVTKNEAATQSDLERERRTQREREALADQRRRQQGPPRRSFAALLRPKP